MRQGIYFVLTLIVSSVFMAPGGSTANAQSVSVSWELERGFRFFKYGSDFQFQRLAVMDFQAKHDKRLPSVQELDETLADLNWWYAPVDAKVGKWFGRESPIKPIELLREWRLDEISRLNRPPGYLELADRLKKEGLSDWEYHPARLGWGSLLFPAHQTPEDIGKGRLIAASSVAVCWNRESQRHDNCDREDPYVVPTSHTVILRAVTESSGERILDGSCIWKIQADNGAKFVKPAAPDVFELRINCDQMVVVSVPYKRDTRIDLQVSGEAASATINVTDVLVVGIGDSFSSGEGNPDVPAKLAWTTDRQVDPVAGPAPIFDIVSDGPVRKQAGEYFAAQWIDRACHRSAYSYQLRSALQLALIDPTRAVTFLGYACSGAEVNKGLFNAFQGTERDTYKIKMAQWRQAQFPLLLSELCEQYDGSQVKSLSTDQEDQLIAKDHYHILAKGGAASDLAYKCQNQIPKNGFKRSIDLMYISIGGNDLGFGNWLLSSITSEGRFGAFLPILKGDDACKRHIDSCRQTEARMKRLHARYSLLREFIDGRLLFSNRPVAPIFFYTYPLPIRTTEGKPCPAGNAGLTIFAKKFQAPKPKVCLRPEQGGVQVLDTIATFADRHLNGEIINLVKSYTSDGQMHPDWISVNDYQAAFSNRSYCASNVKAASNDTAPMEPTEGCLSSAQAEDLASRIQLRWRAAQETLHLPIVRQNWMPFDPIFQYRPYFHRSRLLRTMNETYFLINQLPGTSQTSRAMGVLDLRTAAVSGVFHPTAEAHAIIAGSFFAKSHEVLALPNESP